MPHYTPGSDTEVNCPDEGLDASTENDDDSTSSEDIEVTHSNVDYSPKADKNPDSNICLNNENHSNDRSGESQGKIKKKGPESARDLVKSQENLILMLQRMKNDLSKIDREATSIKEEVVRSRQVFEVVVANRRIHQLDQSANGYNLKYALPRVTYSPYKRHTDSNWKSSPHLCQLSSFQPSSLETSRSSSFSQASRRGLYQTDIEHIGSNTRQNHRRKYQQSTESDLSDRE